jgi:hypothetical protein
MGGGQSRGVEDGMEGPAAARGGAPVGTPYNYAGQQSE